MKLSLSLLYAMSIGDGYVFSRKDKRYNTISSGLIISHSIKQKEYIEFKRDLLVSHFGGVVNIHEFNNNNYPGLRISKTNPIFRKIHKSLYKDGKKFISREILNTFGKKALAIWYMDDGGMGVKRRNGKIHAFELFLNTHISKEDNQIIIDYFNEVWDIKFSSVKNKGHYRLRCGTREGRKFISLVEPYILESLRYKIDPLLTRPNSIKNV